MHHESVLWYVPSMQILLRRIPSDVCADSSPHGVSFGASVDETLDLLDWRRQSFVLNMLCNQSCIVINFYLTWLLMD